MDIKKNGYQSNFCTNQSPYPITYGQTSHPTPLLGKVSVLVNLLIEGLIGFVLLAELLGWLGFFPY